MFKHILNFILLGTIVGAAAVSNVSAQDAYNIKTMTPLVERALENRCGRYNELSMLKARGAIGENNRGYLEVLDNSNSDAKAVANAENADRKVIYETIAEQNGLSGEMGTIEKVFAQVQRDKAQVGEMTQDDSGNWVKKS